MKIHELLEYVSKPAYLAKNPDLVHQKKDWDREAADHRRLITRGLCAQAIRYMFKAYFSLMKLPPIGIYISIHINMLKILFIKKVEVEFDLVLILVSQKYTKAY